MHAENNLLPTLCDARLFILLHTQPPHPSTSYSSAGDLPQGYVPTISLYSSPSPRVMTVNHNIRTVANDSGSGRGLITITKYLTSTTLHICSHICLKNLANIRTRTVFTMSHRAARCLRPYLFHSFKRSQCAAYTRNFTCSTIASSIKAPKDVTNDYEKRVAQLEAYKPRDEWYPRVTQAERMPVDVFQKEYATHTMIGTMLFAHVDKALVADR
jgi:hypothetical protein